MEGYFYEIKSIPNNCLLRLNATYASDIHHNMYISVISEFFFQAFMRTSIDKCMSASLSLFLVLEVINYSPYVYTVTRVHSQGHVTVSINVVTKDLWKQGYRTGATGPPTTGPTVISDLNATHSRPFSPPDRRI